MAQLKLAKVEPIKNGVKLTFSDLDGKEISGVYNGNKLDLEKLEKMIGQDISFTEDKYEEAFINIHKAWKNNGKLTFCDEPEHGMDR